MDNDVIDRASVGIISLYATRSRVPDLNRPIFRAGDHPFTLAMEGYAGDIPAMSVKGKEGIRVCGADIVEFDIMVAGSSEVAFVRRNAETVDLRVGMLDGA